MVAAIKPAPDLKIHWLRRFVPGLAAHRPVKTVVIPVFVTGFFAAYFQLLHHPIFPVTIMPLLGPDRMIDFLPAAFLPYASLWLYVFLPPAVLHGRSELQAYATGVAVVTGVGLGLFLVWPTSIPPPPDDWARFPAFEFLHRIDTAGNACPSLHVAFAVLSAIWLERLLRDAVAPSWVRGLNGAWCALIAYSTLATKQHVAVDVLAGTVLGFAGGMWHSRPVGPDHPHPVLNRQILAFGLSLAAKLLIPALALWPAHPLISSVLFFGPDVWILSGLLVPNTTWLMPIIREFATPRREVWLTIDDGPDAVTTRRMLDLLDRHEAKATFFVIGTKVAENPGLIGEIVRHGHTLGNHTHTHPLAIFWLAGPRRTAREIDACQAALHAAGAPATVWFRAPAGIRNFFLRSTLAHRGIALVGWTGRGREHFSTSPEQPLRRLKKHLRPGAILLLHASAARGEERVALLAGLLDQLALDGYRCVLPAPADLR